MSEWSANVVRIPIMANAWRELGSAEALRRLDQSVAWAGKYGQYVIVDFHSIGFPPGDYYRDEANATSTSEIRTFWHLISSRYADNNVVAFYELYNEPSAGGIWEKTEAERLSDWLVWKEYVEELIDHIRVNDPDKIVIVGGLSWCQDLVFVLQAPIERENVAYAAHPYPATPDWETNIGNVKIHFPVIATEFGFNNDDEDFWMTEAAYEGEGRYREAVMSYLEAHRISWVAWCFSNHWGPRLLQSVDCEPTEPGEFFREQLQNLDR